MLTTLIASIVFHLATLAPVCVEMSEVDLGLLCAEYPIGEAEGCDFPPTAERCHVVGAMLAKCGGITDCDYIACAAALAAAPCGTTANELDACEGVMKCRRSF